MAQRRQIVIIGGGIVGAALAAECVARGMGRVTVIDRGSRDQLAGSTGHAPGYIGAFSRVAILTELALNSIEKYSALTVNGAAGFARVGSLDLADGDPEMDIVQHRYRMARDLGLTATPVTARQAAALAPHLVSTQICTGGVHYGQDGTARADVLTAALRAQAESGGAEFRYNTEVYAIEQSGDHVRSVRTSQNSIAVDDLVIAAGIWGPSVAALLGYELPVTPVGHPYVYGPRGGCKTLAAPFVRWPVKHVYIRDHDGRIGLGSYDHEPLPLSQQELGNTAEREWLPELFDPPLARALDLLPKDSRFQPVERLNGIFSMTPDNLPLIGPAATLQGLWFGEAIWVTHAYGAADLLASWMATGAVPDRFLAMRPDRFGMESPQTLRARSLRLYRHDYGLTPTTSIG